MSSDQENGGAGGHINGAGPGRFRDWLTATLDHPGSSGWSGASSDRSADGRVVAALEEYLSSLKAGAAPSRQEFLDRHPEIAETLGHCLSGLELVHAASGMLGPDPARLVTQGPEGSEIPSTARLGDYRIVRELGRGSMGVVYEAEQISLGRRVALKVLPMTAAMDPRQRQRFLIEAQAAAQLHHPHIVPVFAAGCDQGVHFYAMRYVDGHSLAESVGGLPADPRAIARLGIQAAEALEHAHNLGVVHRDIKPANLLVDSQGSLWVTDFGLAHFRGDLSLTRSGDLVGTLRYMSPEQALARRGVVDQRTDIYALGLTLYELLTRRPAFDGRDYHELLRQIAQEEPIPPRRLDPEIPRDLETIILKAIRKDASGRYATAQELADDLARFCADKPILARRPTLLEQAVRQTRRHRQIVVTAVTVLILALAGGAAAVWSQGRKTEAMRKDLHSYILASFPPIDTITMTAMQKVTEAAMGPGPEIKQAQMFEIYRKALEVYELAAKLPPADLASRTIVARANTRIGFTRSVMSRVAPQTPGKGSSHLLLADYHYRQAVAQFEDLMKEAPGDPEIRCRFADALGEWGLGWFLAITQGSAAGEPFQRRAIALRRELVLQPGLETDLVATELVKLVQLSRSLAGFLQAGGKPHEADALRGDLATVCRSLAGQTSSSKTRHALAQPLAQYGSALLVEDQRAEAVEILNLSLILDPDAPGAQNNLAWALVSDPAVPPYDPSRAIEVIRKSVALEPDNWGSWNTLGVAAYRLGDWKTANEALEKSMSLNNGGDATDWFFVAMTRWQQGRKDEARTWFNKAVAWTREKQPQNHELHRFQAQAEALLGLRGAGPK
jgi:tetratricopeptide (TPR) repeat protein